MNPPAEGLDQTRIGRQLGDNLVVGVVGIDPIPLRLTLQARTAVAVGSALRPRPTTATGIDNPTRGFGANIKLVTVSQASQADPWMDADTFDGLGHDRDSAP